MIFHTEGHPSLNDSVCSLMMAVERLVLSIPNFFFTQCPVFWSHLFIRLGVHGTIGKELARLV